MKYIKILGLLVVAAAAMLAFAASASATTVTGPSTKTNGEPASQVERETPVIHAVQEGTHVELHNAIVNIKCQSTVEGKVETHGSGITAVGAISTLNFFNCTDEWKVDVEKPGILIVHWTEGSNGTLTSTGARVIATRSGLECIYETNETDIGTVTGEKGEKGEATLDIKASIPRVGGSFLCGGATAAWTGSYITTHTLGIDP